MQALQSQPIVNTSILVEAKKEYTKHVCNLLAPILMDGLQNIYNNCKDECDKNQDPELLKSFQKTLKQIPRWNQDIIDTEYERIIEHENCDILDDLVKAVFITNIKILSSVTNNIRPKKVRIEIPSSKRFIHKCYIESAREIYKDPFLVYNEKIKPNISTIVSTIVMNLVENKNNNLNIQFLEKFDISQIKDKKIN